MLIASRVICCVFSQSGSTHKVSEIIAEGIRSSGREVVFHRIGAEAPADINDFDVIGIGCPVYAFRPPFHVSDFIKSLPDLKNKYFFTFITYGTNPGACGNMIRKAMLKKHAMDAGYLATRGEDYFIGYLRKGYLFSPGYPGAFELQTAAEFGMQVIHRIEYGFPSVEPYDPPTEFIYAMERFTINRFNTKFLLSKSFRVSKDCDGCGICIKKCPVGNLSMGKNNRPEYDNKCILCATCEFKCPRDAIRSPYDWGIIKSFFNYNIRHAIKKYTPYSKVKFENARLVRV